MCRRGAGRRAARICIGLGSELPAFDVVVSEGRFHVFWVEDYCGHYRAFGFGILAEYFGVEAFPRAVLEADAGLVGDVGARSHALGKEPREEGVGLAHGVEALAAGGFGVSHELGRGSPCGEYVGGDAVGGVAVAGCH